MRLPFVLLVPLGFIACVPKPAPAPALEPVVHIESAATEPGAIPVLGLELGLPPPPQFVVPDIPIMASDGTWSVLGLRSVLDEMLPEAEANRVVLVSAYVQEIYAPPVCPEGQRCPPPKQSHAWIVDDPGVRGKQLAMMVPGIEFPIPEWDTAAVDAWASEPELELVPGRRYVFMGWLRRFTNSGFGHDRGLLELLAVTDHPLAADARWIFPRNSEFHPRARATQRLPPLEPELARVPAHVTAGAPLSQPGPLVEPIDRKEAAKLARDEAWAGQPFRSDYYQRWLIVDDPSDTWPWVELGNLYLDNGEFEAGLGIVDLAVVRAPNDYVVHAGRGRLLLNAGDPTAASESYRRAAELAPTAADVWFGLGMAYAEASEREQAIEALERFLQLAAQAEPPVPEHIIRAANDTILRMHHVN